MTTKNDLSTAKICAFARAYHSNFSRSKVFDDYLAYDFMGKEDYDDLHLRIETDELFHLTMGKKSSAGDFIRHFLAPVMLSRICFAESKLKAFAAAHGPCQYVICGAGYDTFSFRNGNPDITIFEVDHPDMQATKRRRIEDLQWNVPNNVNFVPVDFEKDDFIQELLRSGFDPRQKTFFSILGVAYYLTLPVFAKTIADISTLSTQGSMVVFDYPDEDVHRDGFTGRIRKLAHMTERMGEKMRGGYRFEDLTDALFAEGFAMDDYLAATDIQKRFFSKNGDGLQALQNVYLISAQKSVD